MSESAKEFIRHQFMTFNDCGEVCDLLNIDVEALLNAFPDELLEYAEAQVEDD